MIQNTNKHAGKGGFTLLELLLVLVIVGILASLGMSTFIRAQRNAQLQEATVQFAADLQRARSAAQRHNQNARVALGEEPAAYTLALGGETSERRLPHDAQVRVERGSARVTYTAPYGEVGALNKRFVITSGRTERVRYVKVIGVTGKVIISDS